MSILTGLRDIIRGVIGTPPALDTPIVEEPVEIADARRALADGRLARAEVLCRIALNSRPDDPSPLRLLEKIGERLHLRSLSFFGGPAPVTGQRYVVIKPWGCGLWSDVDHALGQLLLASMTGRIPVTDWGGASRYALPDGRDAWRSLFQPVSDLEVGDLLPLASGPDGVFPAKWADGNLNRSEMNRFSGPGSRLSGLYLLARPERIVVSDFYTSVETLSFWIPIGHPLHGKTVREIYRDLCNRYIRVVMEIGNEIERFRDHHFSGRRVVAAHVRGTDKVDEQKDLCDINAATLRATEHLATELDAEVIFLLTDEAAVVETFRSRFGKRLICTGADRTSGRVGLHFRDDMPRAALAREVVVDVLLAASADGFIGNGGSNVSAMVEHLKDWPTGRLWLSPPSVHYQFFPHLCD